MNKNNEVEFWDKYANVYDLMAKNNPAYQTLITNFIEIVEKWNIPSSGKIFDIGGGTGNFSIILATIFPACRVFHIDSNISMSNIAEQKAAFKNLSNIDFVNEDANTFLLNNHSDAIVCIHSLYSMPDQKIIIKRMFDSLKSEGHLFVCDIGRVLNVNDWARYLFVENYKKFGLAKTLSLFFRGRTVAKVNRKISDSQKSGKFWLHSNKEFINIFKSVGFNIVKANIEYRGYSDVLWCEKP